jgi:hypothetical protein
MRKSLAQGTGIAYTHIATSIAMCLYVPLQQGTFNETFFLYLCQLLQKVSAYRLGSHGMYEIKQHRFFKHIDWEDLLDKRVKPPYVPSVVSLICCPVVFMEAESNLIHCNTHRVAKFYIK